MGNTPSQSTEEFFTGSNGNPLADSLVAPLVNAIQQDSVLKNVIQSIAPTSTPSKTTGYNNTSSDKSLYNAFNLKRDSAIASAFQQGFNKQNMKTATPYIIDSTFLVANVVPGGKIATTGLSMVGVDAGSIDKAVGVEPSPIYKVQEALINGVMGFLFNPMGGISSIASFLQNPSLNSLGIFTGVIPKISTSSSPTITQDNTLLFLESVAIVGGVLLYRYKS